MRKRAPMPPARTVFTDPVHFLAFGFGLGLSRIAPGTVGTLAALPLIVLGAAWPLWVQAGLAVVVTLIGFPICGVSAARLNAHDHPGIVWDEIAGWLITMILVPVTVGTVILGFLLFRAFDIVKPWPIGWLDRRVQGGFGIMIDDVLAGAMAAVVLWLVYSGWEGLLTAG